MKFERYVAAFLSKRIAVITSASTVIYAASLCDMVPMFIGVSFRTERKLEIGLRVYTNAGDVASASRSPCVHSADPVLGFSLTFPFAVVSV